MPAAPAAPHPYGRDLELDIHEALHRGSRGVPAMVTIRASELADLRDELVAERAETRAFATLVLGIANGLAAGPRPAMAAVNDGGRLVTAATRRLRQISSSVL
jgi:hypothetical protein